MISVINNTVVSSYKAEELLVHHIKDVTLLKNGYNIMNSIKLADDINNLKLHFEHKFITVEMKDIFVNTSRVPTVLLQGN
jgi:hypothetical protein